MKLEVSLSPRITLVALLAITLALASCNVDPIGDLDGVGNVRINRDTTWTSRNPILLEGTVNIDGATLTIEAGTTIRMGRNGAIVVGENQAGTLLILGTAAAPVRFIPSSKENYWRGIHILRSTSGSLITHCELEQASYSDASAFVLADANFIIDHLSLKGCEGDGLEILRASPQSSAKINNLYIETPTGHPIKGQVSLLYALGSNITLSAPQGGIYLTSGTLTAERVIFPNYAYPYIIRSELNIDVRKLQFGRQTRFEFERNGALNLGAFAETHIEADGVTFTSRSKTKTPGSWKGVIVNSYVMGRDSYFRNCTFEAGGGSTERGNLILYGVKELEVSNSLFARSAGFGIVLYNGASMREQGNHFNSNASGERKNY